MVCLSKLILLSGLSNKSDFLYRHFSPWDSNKRRFTYKGFLVSFDRTILFFELCRVLAISESVVIFDRIFLEVSTRTRYYSDRLRHPSLPCILSPTHTLSIFTDCDLSSTDATHTFYAILFPGGREAKV